MRGVVRAPPYIYIYGMKYMLYMKCILYICIYKLYIYIYIYMYILYEI